MSAPRRTPRLPLFPLWALLCCGFLASIVVLVGLWLALGTSNWSATLAASAVFVTLLVCFTVGEFIRGRFRLSLRVLLASMTMLAILLGLLGNRAYHARNQRRAVQSIIRAGGEVRHDIDESFGGGWVRTGGGLIFPEWLLEVLGPDMFGDVNNVFFPNGVISEGDDLADIDFGNFSSVRFSNCLLGDEAIARIGTLSDVRYLYLVQTGIEDEDLASISRLENLDYLMLGMNPGITHKGLRNLSQMKNLRVLDLTDTGITGEGLAELTTLEHLEWLVLARTPITDDDLTQLQKMSNLRSINLRGTEITDQGVEQLYALPNLQWVNLHNTKTTVEAISKLERALGQRRVSNYED